MASKELTTVMEELTRQGELNRREHLLNRREHRLNRRAYEEGMALCLRAMERYEEVVDMNVQALRDMSRQIRDSVDEQRAQRQALFQVIDRMDRLDGGASAG